MKTESDDNEHSLFGKNLFAHLNDPNAQRMFEHSNSIKVIK